MPKTAGELISNYSFFIHWIVLFSIGKSCLILSRFTDATPTPIIWFTLDDKSECSFDVKLQFPHSCLCVCVHY